MRRISTHVLDTARGKPAADVAVRLERRESAGDWVLLGSARTGRDGRCAQLLPEHETVGEGLYRLAFDTSSYYVAQDQEAFYPAVEITFRVREDDEHFHIPLLLSPYGYTTYRGS